ncbi:MAG: nucleotidyltransferase domain-containing protein [Bacillota bacterium]
MTEMKHIQKALATVIHATESKPSKWVVGGSAGLMLRGIPLSAAPRDLDIYCDDEDMYSIFQSLREFAVDEPTVSVTGMYRSRLCHFHIHNVQVELVGGFQVKASGCHYATAVRELLIPYGKRIKLSGTSQSVYVAPLAHELCFNMLRGRSDRVQLIVQAFAEAPEIHTGALQAIELGNAFTEPVKCSIHRLINEREAGVLR